MKEPSLEWVLVSQTRYSERSFWKWKRKWHCMIENIRGPSVCPALGLISLWQVTYYLCMSISYTYHENDHIYDKHDLLVFSGQVPLGEYSRLVIWKANCWEELF